MSLMSTSYEVLVSRHACTYCLQILLPVLSTFWFPAAVAQTPASSGQMLINARRILWTAALLSAMSLLQAYLYWWRCAVQGLLAFKQSVQDPAGVLESWNPSILPNPCSSANCSTNVSTRDCNWAGIACQNWEVVALVAPCTTLPDGRDIGCALMGSPLDILTQVGQARWHYCLVLANRYNHLFSN